MRGLNLFSEIYGAYYRTAARVLEHERVTAKEINEIISEEAFRDSVLFIQPKLMPREDGSDWRLLSRNEDGSFSRRTALPPPKIVTNIQKAWLKAKLADPKFRLFFDDDTLIKLTHRLENVKPLHTPEHFHYPDVFADGDDYLSESYRRIFRAVLTAIRTKELLEISYSSGHGKEFRGFILPVKMVYSRKNDKFRVYVNVWKSQPCTGKNRHYSIMNIGRIESVTPTGKHFEGAISERKMLKSFRCGEPVKVFVSTERNAVERFMMEFSAYEKHTVRDLRTGCCMVELWYDKLDETELLIRLLSFGPTVEILGPKSFRAQAARRVKRQHELLFGNGETKG